LIIAIISDIHSNLAALRAVLDDMVGVEKIYSLGDLVGYGPQPNEVLDLIKDKLTYKLSGNHDLGCIGEMDLGAFTSDAKDACNFTDTVLTKENRNYLHSLQPVEVAGDATLVHASPREPVWEYILNEVIACQNFGFFQTSIAFVGHTHVPIVYKKSKPNTVILHEESVLELDPGEKVIINPGSVGQPRDGNPKSSYILFNEDKLTITLKRVAYDIEVTQKAMGKVNLPRNLIERLALGL